jgi:fermentation-respiration switch protein FrsA (DUF1100 family)
VWLVTLYFLQTGMLFPSGYAGQPTAGPPPGAIVHTLDVDGGAVEAWLLPALPGSAAEAGSERAPLVVIFHGNAELIDGQVWFANKFRALGCAVLLPEYRGYGRSAGSPGQDAIVEDASRFHDWAVAQPGIDPARVVIFGRSVGGGVAAQLAARRACAAVILESTFTSVASMAWRYGAPPFLLRHPFRSDRVLPSLGRPALIFHGDRDSIIPVSQGRALHAMTPGSVYIEFPTDHNDFPARRFEREYWSAVERFMNDAGILAEPDRATGTGPSAPADPGSP